ncbi:uncharacterized protein HHUB_4284 (plasmid) [Halobacterium hubeiense]|uniref:Uncharacterized protein n=1 Tax=Halobacterium hubeiense TaxID=1407499 RepID=A0A0U5H8Q3_9EURY|nr:hypothetical protein [Halobacterium hubeiense]CQH64119.1 uncharacterized protein HHUB_4284 [Halobacterium hubeiense]
MEDSNPRYKVPSQCPECGTDIKQVYDSSDSRTLYCGQCDEVIGVVSGDEPFELPSGVELVGEVFTGGKEDICGGFSPENHEPDYEFQPGDTAPGVLLPFQSGAEVLFRNQTLLWKHSDTKWKHYHIWSPNDSTKAVLGGTATQDDPLIRWAHPVLLHGFDAVHDLED